jgi:hypothetical protein
MRNDDQFARAKLNSGALFQLGPTAAFREQVKDDYVAIVGGYVAAKRLGWRGTETPGRRELSVVEDGSRELNGL